jgi:hypothetical protein
MSQRKILPALFCLAMSAVTGFGQSARKPENTQSRAHVEAALKIAGPDSFLLNPYNFFCIPGGARPNNVNAPELEPVKIFDNVYAVGNSAKKMNVEVELQNHAIFDGTPKGSRNKSMTRRAQSVHRRNGSLRPDLEYRFRVHSGRDCSPESRLGNASRYGATVIPITPLRSMAVSRNPDFRTSSMN